MQQKNSNMKKYCAAFLISLLLYSASMQDLASAWALYPQAEKPA